VREIAPLPRGAAPNLRVLVVGGSLAAKSLNDLVVLAAADLARIPRLEIVHLAGEDDRGRVANIYAEAGLKAEVHGFWADMPGLYRRIDLAVTRAGATTVAELCCAGIGALYIPLPWAADDHQTANAQAVAAVGGAVVLPQATTRASAIAALLADLAADRGRVAQLGRQARTLARPDAAERVADLVVSVATPPAATTSKAAARTAFRQELVDSVSIGSGEPTR
jgi:UDP-N-acetylglucosamine--N-acetylmuramyl-(pentapeptide) pyrophosphoryl-undecaprenol N-acetylglucosamine transferase